VELTNGQGFRYLVTNPASLIMSQDPPLWNAPLTFTFDPNQSGEDTVETGGQFNNASFTFPSETSLSQEVFPTSTANAHDEFARFEPYTTPYFAAPMLNADQNTIDRDIDYCKRLIDTQCANHQYPPIYIRNLLTFLTTSNISQSMVPLHSTVPREAPATESTPSTLGGRRSPKYRCRLCVTEPSFDRPSFTTRGSFKRHVKCYHYLSEYTCVSCGFHHARLDKMREHLQSVHVDVALPQFTARAPDAPPNCPICSLQHRFADFDDWWKHIVQHCRIGEE
jgi:hypothetical protein